jgi:hypothetical protein
MFTVGNKATPDNRELINRLILLLASLGVKSYLSQPSRTKVNSQRTYDASQVFIVVEGLTSVLDCLLPLLLELQHL